MLDAEEQPIRGCVEMMVRMRHNSGPEKERISRQFPLYIIYIIASISSRVFFYAADGFLNCTSGDNTIIIIICGGRAALFMISRASRTARFYSLSSFLFLNSLNFFRLSSISLSSMLLTFKASLIWRRYWTRKVLAGKGRTIRSMSSVFGTVRLKVCAICTDYRSVQQGMQITLSQTGCFRTFN